MAPLWIAAGLLLVLVGFNDVFHTLLHPAGHGRISRGIIRGVWRTARHLPARARSVAGPVACVAVIASWAAFQVIGWALIYYPSVPAGFLYSPGLDEGRYGDAAEALYFSLVTLSTLGFGDTVPVSPLIRLVAPLEALGGFALLTAAISWFLQLYPTLAARRALALRLALLREAAYADTMAEQPAVAAQALHLLTGDLARIRVEMAQSTESYYFHESDPRMSLPETIGYAVELAEAAARTDSPPLRAGGRLLSVALEDLGTLLRQSFEVRGDGSVEEVLDAYAAHHRGRR